MMRVRGLCDAGGEARLSSILRQRFPEAAEVEVQDISGEQFYQARLRRKGNRCEDKEKKKEKRQWRIEMD